jgi:preprotein translocase subunit SecB
MNLGQLDMSDNKHPIQLDQVLFTRSVVIALPDHKPSDLARISLGPENSIDVTAVDGQDGKYQVSMSSKLNINGDSVYPYIIDMECIGVFSVDTKLSPEEAIRGVTITGNSVLYGAIREAVAWLTGRQPFGPLMLGLSVLRPSQPDLPKN